MQRPSRETLIRYFRGQSLPHETTLVDLYLAMDIDRTYIESCLKDAWPDMHATTAPPLNQAALDDFKARFHLRQQALSPTPATTQRSIYWYRYAASAAVLALGMCFLLFFYLRSRPVHTYYARTGASTPVLLADSSEVILFPGSTLEIFRGYNEENRNVTLTGRAFFQVSHNEQLPFRATAGDITTRVLGTSFEINPQDREDAYTITLRTGKVSVDQRDKLLATLKPDEQFIYYTGTKKYATRPVDASRLTTWIKGELEYELVPLSVICRDMEKWYGVTIEIRNKAFETKKITTSFRDEPVEKVLEVLSEISGLHYEIDENQITLE